MRGFRLDENSPGVISDTEIRPTESRGISAGITDAPADLGSYRSPCCVTGSGGFHVCIAGLPPEFHGPTALEALEREERGAAA